MCSPSAGTVGAGRRLGNAERLQMQLAARDQRQVALFLRVAAMPQLAAVLEPSYLSVFPTADRGR
ncbi:MAG: hypothetical protein ACM3IH_07355 [Sphingobacteriales bacterium]|jgi:hypothetical protein